MHGMGRIRRQHTGHAQHGELGKRVLQVRPRREREWKVLPRKMKPFMHPRRSATR